MKETDQTTQGKELSKFMRAEEVQEMLDCSKAHAYRVIQRLNKELEKQGKITVQGRVSRKYLMERIYA